MSWRRRDRPTWPRGVRHRRRWRPGLARRAWAQEEARDGREEGVAVGRPREAEGGAQGSCCGRERVVVN